MGLLSRTVIAAIAIACAGCATTVWVESTASMSDQSFREERFFLEFDDRTSTSPDNVDGNINLLWTNKKARTEVVGRSVEELKQKLIDGGFVFVETIDESSVTAVVTLTAVRYDPTAGWLTDDAVLHFIETGSSQSLGTVHADEQLVTPSLNSVIDGLVRGSLDLWGPPTG